MKRTTFIHLAAVIGLGFLTQLPADAGVLSFSSARYQAGEGDGTVTITVRLDRSDDPDPGNEVTVDYKTIGGSATPDVDYIDVQGTLVFEAGQTSQSFTVPIVDDLLIENTENFSAIIFNPQPQCIRRPSDPPCYYQTPTFGTSSATIDIFDNDRGNTIQFNPASYSARESGPDGRSNGTVVLNVTVERFGDPDDVLEVTYTTVDGSARAGEDYISKTDKLRFERGQTQQPITIDLINDRFIEDAEQFSVQLSAPTNETDPANPPQFSPRGSSVATVTIADDDSPTSTLQFSASDYTVNEDGGLAEVTVVRSGGIGLEVTVDYVTSNGTATAGSDYTASSGRLTFRTGETSQPISVPITKDAVSEPTETFTISLSNPSPSFSASVGSPSTATVSIVNVDPPPPPAITSPGQASGQEGRPFSYQITATNNPRSYGATGLPANGLSLDTATGLISGTPKSPGRMTLTISATNDGGTGTAPLTITIDPAPPEGPVITSPSSATGTQGQPFSYQITATNNPTSFDASGLPIGLFVNRSNGLISGTPSTAGRFDVTLRATNSSGATGTSNLDLTINPAGATPTPTPTPTPTASPSPTASPGAPPSDLANVSTRARAGTGNDVLIGGMIIQGGAPKRVIVRAVGPSLEDVGVAGSLADPTLELYDGSGQSIGFNDDWKTGGQRAEIEQTGVPPGNERESALVMTLPAGNYTAVVRGANGGTGVALVEAYDLDPNSSRLVNISTRSNVSIGDNVMIGGFIIGSEQPTKVMVRAIGPSLSQATPPVQNALMDPSLELRDGQGSLITSNDNWVNSPQQQQIQQSGLAPSDGRESAIIATLPKGSYTAIVRSSDGRPGIGLVEVYRLND
jgi:hypothetical protein